MLERLRLQQVWKTNTGGTFSLILASLQTILHKLIAMTTKYSLAQVIKIYLKITLIIL